MRSGALRWTRWARWTVPVTGLIVAGACTGPTERGATGTPAQGEAMTSEAKMAEEASVVDPIRGKTIRWRWTDGLGEDEADGPFTHEHTFHEDGTVTWRVLSGPAAGHSATEDRYAAVGVGANVYVVSYLARSGHTLTVTLDFDRGTMVGFASGEREWHPGRGIFEVADR